MLGCVEGKRVVELGAGIGRFTGCLAATARNVLAVDFMENLVQENQRANSHRQMPAASVVDCGWKGRDSSLPACHYVISSDFVPYLLG